MSTLLQPIVIQQIDLIKDVAAGFNPLASDFPFQSFAL
jgi:hypothetical protein